MGNNPRRPEPGPALSVVLPVLNEVRDIARVLDESIKQTPPPGGFEIVVADGGSTDGTREIVQALAAAWPQVRLLDNPGRLSSAGRNVGARAARGRYVLFLDGHCSLPRSDLFARTVEIFEETGADCLCRPQPLDRLAEGDWARAIAAARHSWFGHNARSDIYRNGAGFTDPRSAGAAYKRSVLGALGGYDERFDACEDVEFNHRVAVAGYRAYLHPDLAVHYRARSSFSGLFRQMTRYGRGRARLMARHPVMTPWPLVFATLLVLVVVTSTVAFRSDTITTPAAVLLGLWVGAAGFESMRRSRSTSDAGRAVAAFAAIHTGLLWGFWRGLLEWCRFRRPMARDASCAWPGLVQREA